MKLINRAICAATICAAGAFHLTAVAAQEKTETTKTVIGDSKTTVKTTTDVKEGTDVKLIGCLERDPAGGFMLTSLDTGAMRYQLITNDNLEKYVEHRVQVSGKAADLGKGKVSIETKVDGKVNASGEVNRKTTIEHDGALGLKMLGLKSVKNLSDSCR